MSKIQFNELNNTSLEVLNEQETTAVVGGIIAIFSDLSQRQNVGIVSADNTAAVLQGGAFNFAGIGQGSNVNVNQG